MPYYVDSSKVHIIVQQPADFNEKFCRSQAAIAYPEAKNQYHQFVRFYLLRKINNYTWPKLSLESYFEDSKLPYELLVSFIFKDWLFFSF